jgi:hypothetical protein
MRLNLVLGDENPKAQKKRKEKKRKEKKRKGSSRNSLPPQTPKLSSQTNGQKNFFPNAPSLGHSTPFGDNLTWLLGFSLEVLEPV